jgi:hypothetical protein
MSLLPGKERAKHKQRRQKHDFYIEPDWCVDQLFVTVRFRGPIHDPCCGRNIVLAAQRAGYEASGADLVDRGFGETGVRFQEDLRPRTTLVLNSPSGQHEEFIMHALEVASETVAVIVPIPFLDGQERFWELYRPFPPAYVLCCSERPSMPPGDEPDVKPEGGTADYCWLIWSRRSLHRFRDLGRPAGSPWWCSPQGTVLDWVEPLSPRQPPRRFKRTTAPTAQPVADNVVVDVMPSCGLPAPAPGATAPAGEHAANGRDIETPEIESPAADAPANGQDRPAAPPSPPASVPELWGRPPDQAGGLVRALLDTF